MVKTRRRQAAWAADHFVQRPVFSDLCGSKSPQTTDRIFNWQPGCTAQSSRANPQVLLLTTYVSMGQALHRLLLHHSWAAWVRHSAATPFEWLIQIFFPSFLVGQPISGMAQMSTSSRSSQIWHPGEPNGGCVRGCQAGQGLTATVNQFGWCLVWFKEGWR